MFFLYSQSIEALKAQSTKSWSVHVEISQIEDANVNHQNHAQ